MPSLTSFQEQFGLSSGTDAGQLRNFVSIIYVGYTLGAAGSYLINNRLGRLWSYRLYVTIYIIGQLIAVFSPNRAALYVGRIVAGAGIGSVTAIGPIALVEIAPAEVRGLITAWYPVMISAALMASNLCVFGIYKHVPPSKLQYQIAWFSPCIYMALCIAASFFLCESPRWLLLVNRRREAIVTLVKLRGLPEDHPRVALELQEIDDDIARSDAANPDSFMTLAREMFGEASNLRRLQQVIMAYALAQLTGANSITSYFIPIMAMVGQASGDKGENIFLSGMYGLSKLFFTLISSFFFIDALGRRKSLLVGVAIQGLSHIYIGVFIKKTQDGPVTAASSEAAIAALFIHAFGYAVGKISISTVTITPMYEESSLTIAPPGMLVLPYVFGSELWPNRIRSFGTALGSTFHWAFILAMKYSVPSILDSMNDWGAFIFFAAWCFMSWLYVFFMVPEVAGMSVEEINDLFRGPWFKAYRTRPRHEAEDSDEDDRKGDQIMKVAL